MARAIWKGRVQLPDVEVPVKLYSAVEDRKVHFRLLHAEDLSPIKQRMVRKTDGEEVPKEEHRKAFPLDRDLAVMLEPEDLDELQPPPSREIHVCRFVPPSLIGDQWYDRPYYVGPDGDEEAYFALADAIQRRSVEGIARWVMRKKQYVGALRAIDGYLMMITLRRADQVITVSGVQAPSRRKPDDKEIDLARQLVSTLEADFEPERWEDEYRQRVCELIEAKSRGETVTVEAPRRKRAAGGLAESLRQSLTSAREKRVA